MKTFKQWLTAGGVLTQVKSLPQRGSVPAGKAAEADFGTIGLKLLVGEPKGDTSKTNPPMPKYKTIRGKTQGVA